MSRRDSYVPKHAKYVAKHRGPSSTAQASRRMVHRTVALSTLAVGATGAAVGLGITVGPASISTVAADLAHQAQASEASQPTKQASREQAGESASATGADSAAPAQAERAPLITRSDRRERTTAVKEALIQQPAGPAITGTQDLSDADPRVIAQALLPEYGFSADQFGCLDLLYISESNWRIDADNPYSSAYGIPQALTGLHDLPADYYTSAEAQIRWGLDYIRDAYGTPCSAWSFKQSHQWY